MILYHYSNTIFTVFSTSFLKRTTSGWGLSFCDMPNIFESYGIYLYTVDIPDDLEYISYDEYQARNRFNNDTKASSLWLKNDNKAGITRKVYYDFENSCSYTNPYTIYTIFNESVIKIISVE